MASKNKLIKRGNDLSVKFTEDELKDALKNALVMDDNEERLALQWALKQKTKTKDGFAFTREQNDKMSQKLVV
ncbi:hypothetical protein LCGC14_1017160 [marine sediment metagenome]|uniref:Uncharacterized protein n=1 Tax=marine sediment metagenome TaxID=412755 RepID=A0A0F9QGS9_9ZZZZ